VVALIMVLLAMAQLVVILATGDDTSAASGCFKAGHYPWLSSMGLSVALGAERLPRPDTDDRLRKR